MKVTLEQIDELRGRVNVTYEEAKSTLEKNGGDLIKSIIELEKKKGYKKQTKNTDGFTSFADRLLQLKFLVKSKEGETLIHIPVILVLATFILAFWIVVGGIILAICTSCKIKVYRDKNSIDIVGIKKNVQETVEKIKAKTENIIVDDEDKPLYTNERPNYSSDENEITIE